MREKIEGINKPVAEDKGTIMVDKTNTPLKLGWEELFDGV